MKDFFEVNIKALIQVNPILGAKLFAINEIKDFEVYVDEKDLININIIDKRDFTPIYKTQPVEETLEMIKEFEKFSRYPFLYFYGIGNGIFIKLLLNNEAHKRIIIIEPEIEILYIALHFNDFSKEIKKERLVFQLSSDISFTLMQKYFQYEEKIYLKSYHLDTITKYYEKYHDDILNINKIIIKAIEHTILGLGNDSTDALLGIEQHITNIEQMVKTPSLVNLVRNAKNTELAVIVSTGPSLSKQLKLLDKIKDYVTIISVDASFPILQEHNIKPDIVVSMERIPSTAKFFINTSKEFQEDVIFALTSIQDKTVFKSIKAGTIQIGMRPFGYTRYFGLDSWGYIGIGMSAANFAYEIAYQSKFKRVVLIGQDLSYAQDGNSHADGHIFGKNDKSYRYDDIMVTAYGGEGTIRTSLIWNLFRNFFEVDISNTIDVMETINATEGGARIAGSIEMQFSEVIDKYVDFSKPKQKIKLQQPTQEDIQKNTLLIRNKIDEMLKYAKKIYDDVVIMFNKISENIEHFNKIEARKNLNDVNYDEVFKIIQELDRIKEYFLDKKFVLVFTDAIQAFIFHQEVDIATIQIRDSNTEKSKKLKMLDWIYVHQYWLFSLAGSIKATIDTILFGINEENSEEFLLNMLQKYSEYKNITDYMFDKHKFSLKKRLWPYPDNFGNLVIDMMDNLGTDIYWKNKINQVISQYTIDKNNFIQYTKPKEIWEIRESFVNIFVNIVKEKINSSIDNLKPTIMIYLLEIMIPNEKNSVNSWMRGEIHKIYNHLISKYQNFNIILGIDKNKINNFSFNVDFEDDDIKKYNPIIVGMDIIEKLDNIDYIITTNGIPYIAPSWRKLYDDKKPLELIREVKFNTNVCYITQEDYCNQIDNYFTKE